MRHLLLGAVVLALVHLAAAAAPAAGQSSLDPLDAPALANRMATTTPLSAVTRAGGRLIAVGVRGLIVVSDDRGATWRQRPSPVSSDLLAVQFPTSAQGWAVGHDGVVLHSADGGESWHRQLDGREAGKLLVAHFEKLAAAGDATAARMLDDVRLNYQNGPEQALLDVWFEDDRNGFVCGSFGTLLSTHDGGQTWESWMDRIDSDGLVHLNAMRGVGGGVYIASERGQVFRLDRDRMRFVPSATGYGGSFFSIAGSGGTVVAAGLRGNTYRSPDGGRSWSRLDTHTTATLTGADGTANGRLALVTQGGGVLLSDDAGSTFTLLRAPRAGLLSGIVAIDSGMAVVVGSGGVQQVRLKQIH